MPIFIAGGITTLVDVATFTVPFTSSQLTTLYGTSCTRTAQDTDTDTFIPPPTTSTPTPTLTPTTTSFSTPPPSVYTTAWTSTQADGGTTPVVITVTSTQSPVAISPTSIPGAVGVSNTDKSKNLGPIIGGVVGGIGGLAAIAFLIWFIL